MNTKPERTDDYADQAADETVSQLQVDPAVGLSDSEVQTRLQDYGYNEIREKEEPLWHRIFRRFWGPIPWMIEMAAKGYRTLAVGRILTASGLSVINDVVKMWTYRLLRARGEVPA